MWDNLSLEPQTLSATTTQQPNTIAKVANLEVIPKLHLPTNQRDGKEIANYIQPSIEKCSS